MRFLILVLASALLALGCNDADPAPAPGRPELLRSCGELDDIDPVEPIIVGRDWAGCALFDPVPCTQPRAYYEEICGDGCYAGTGTNADGDEWVPGCLSNCFVSGPDGSEGPFYICNRDPSGSETLWSAIGGCATIYERMICTWPMCDEDPEDFEPHANCP